MRSPVVALTCQRSRRARWASRVRRVAEIPAPHSRAVVRDDRNPRSEYRTAAAHIGAEGWWYREPEGGEIGITTGRHDDRVLMTVRSARYAADERAFPPLIGMRHLRYAPSSLAIGGPMQMRWI